MKTKTKSKTSNQSNQFEKFKSFAQKLIKVPKEEINEQEKKYESKKEKAKS
jgi:hypothetical protein